MRRTEVVLVILMLRCIQHSKSPQQPLNLHSTPGGYTPCPISGHVCDTEWVHQILEDMRRTEVVLVILMLRCIQHSKSPQQPLNLHSTPGSHRLHTRQNYLARLISFILLVSIWLHKCT